MKKGEYRYYKSIEHPQLLLTLWWETILVKALSNCIIPKHVFYKTVRHQFGGKKFKEAPLVFKEYSQNAKGVDLANNLVSTYRNIHRTSKWWHVIFNHYLTVTLNNCYIIYKSQHRDKLHQKMSEYLPRKDFIFIIIRNLLNANGQPDIKDIEFHLSHNKKLKFDETIYPHQYKLVDGLVRKSTRSKALSFRPNCTLCIRKTAFYCKDCYNGSDILKLCLNCFEKYHKDLFIKIEEKKKNRNSHLWNYGSQGGKKHKKKVVLDI